MSNSYKLENGKYLKVESTFEGIEYSIYDENKKLIDGGIILNFDFCLDEVLKMCDLPVDIKYEILDEEIEEGGFK